MTKVTFNYDGKNARPGQVLTMEGKIYVVSLVRGGMVIAEEQGFWASQLIILKSVVYHYGWLALQCVLSIVVAAIILYTIWGYLTWQS
jgi:hypothetical protein